MTLSIEQLMSRFEPVFSPPQATALAGAIHDAYAEVAKASDFTELKEIVRQLAVAQQDLAQAQGRTEARMEELAQAQGRTERELRLLAQELGGLSRSVSYSLENEAYRHLPAFLASHYGINLSERMVRTDVGGEEISLFAFGERNGAPVVIVGETKLQLDRRRGTRDALTRILDQLEEKVKVVQAAHPGRKPVRLLVPHYIRSTLRSLAQERKVIIAQSFEW